LRKQFLYSPKIFSSNKINYGKIPNTNRLESPGNRAAFIWHQCRFCFGVSHHAEIDCLADVSKTKPANFTRCKTAQTGLPLTASHIDILRIFSLIEQQYLIRRTANQLEWPSAKVDTAVPTEPWLSLYLIAVSSYFISINNENWLPTIRSDLGGKINIFGGAVSVNERIDVYVKMCLILNGCWDWAISISRPNSVRFLFVDLDAALSLQQKDN